MMKYLKLNIFLVTTFLMQSSLVLAVEAGSGQEAGNGGEGTELIKFAALPQDRDIVPVPDDVFTSPLALRDYHGQFCVRALEGFHELETLIELRRRSEKFAEVIDTGITKLEIKLARLHLEYNCSELSHGFSLRPAIFSDVARKNPLTLKNYPNGDIEMDPARWDYWKPRIQRGLAAHEILSHPSLKIEAPGQYPSSSCLFTNGNVLQYFRYRSREFNSPALDQIGVQISLALASYTQDQNTLYNLFSLFHISSSQLVFDGDPADILNIVESIESYYIDQMLSDKFDKCRIENECPAELLLDWVQTMNVGRRGIENTRPEALQFALGIPADPLEDALYPPRPSIIEVFEPVFPFRDTRPYSAIKSARNLLRDSRVEMLEPCHP